MVQLIHSILPYLKYILAFIFIVIFALVNRAFLRNPELRRFMLASLSTENKVELGGSGKAFSGIVFSGVIAFASIMAVMYSPSHLLPDYMFISLLSFVAALYSIKLAGKFASNGSSTDGNGNQTTKQTDTNVTATPVTATPDNSTTENMNPKP